MNRIDRKFRQLKKKGQKALITYITAGDPNARFVEDLVPYLAGLGVDVIELGIPFSDPMADGPVIQEASERAIAKGINLKRIFEIVKNVRKSTDVPILLMGYYNNVHQYGLEKVAKAAASAGVDAFLVVDLPPEESGEFQRHLRASGLHQIFLVAPTTGNERLRSIIKRASGFLYYVSITGVTGASITDKKSLLLDLGKVGKTSPIPTVIGFGIKNAKDVKSVMDQADGVVVGSALIDLIKKAGGAKLTPALKNKIKNFITPMVRVLKSKALTS